jgi:hypothetical protein
MLALTFGIVLVSNLFHGPTIPFVIQRLDMFSGIENDVELNNNNNRDLYTDHYILDRYDFNRSIFEKIFFSAPEFIIKDTSFGGSLEIQLRGWWDRSKKRSYEILNSINKIKGY